MQATPKGLRTHIAIFGRRNAGKSSLINALSNQSVSIIAEKPGTTTDPVEKTLEIAPIGPVVLIDTAGLDDSGEVGEMRVKRSRDVFKRTDLAILLLDGEIWDETEKEIYDNLMKSKIPFIIVRNKNDQIKFSSRDSWIKNNGLPDTLRIYDISAKSKTGLGNLLRGLAKLAEISLKDCEAPLLHDLLPQDGLVIFVVPLDTGAPKGRLILPQVQAIRDTLDGHCMCLVTSDATYSQALDKLKNYPDLVVCDSQVVESVAEKTPNEIKLTTFSILMARFKGELTSFAKGAAAIKKLKQGDKIVIEEACSHHPQKDDIGRIKIPRLLEKNAEAKLDFTFKAGKEPGDYPENTKLVVHCGACVLTQKQMKNRQNSAAELNIPMTNYGMAISCCKNVIERVLSPFPEALKYIEKGA